MSTKSTKKFLQAEDCYLEAGKVHVLLKLLETYKEEGRKILIFSQVSSLPIYLICKGIDSILVHSDSRYPTSRVKLQESPFPRLNRQYTCRPPSNTGGRVYRRS